MGECVFLNKGVPFENVVRIGAHHGEEGKDYLQSGVKSVIWVEALKKFMSSLYDNTKSLNLKQKYINACLSDVSNEKITFNIANNGQSSSMLNLGTHSSLHPQVSYVDHIELTTQRFEDIAVKENIDVHSINFVNLDVQGAELKVLKGFGDILSCKNIKAIYTEINFEHVYENCCLANELDSYLGNYSFKRVKTKGEIRQWGDALYLRA